MQPFSITREVEGKPVRIEGRVGQVDKNSLQIIDSVTLLEEGEEYEFWDAENDGFPPADIFLFESSLHAAVMEYRVQIHE